MKGKFTSVILAVVLVVITVGTYSSDILRQVVRQQNQA